MQNSFSIEIESTRRISSKDGLKLIKQKEESERTYTIFEKLENGEPKLPCDGGLRVCSRCSREGRPAPRPAAIAPPP